MFCDLIRRIFAKKKSGFSSTKRRQPLRALQLGVETLEQRLVPSAPLKATILGLPASLQSPEGTSLTVKASVSNSIGTDYYSWVIFKSKTQFATGHSSSITFTP